MRSSMVDRILEHDQVLTVIAERVRTGSKPGKRDDGFIVGGVFQGGGMRAVRGAGMCIGIAHVLDQKHPGLGSGYLARNILYNDAIDLVRHSKEGSIHAAIRALNVGDESPKVRRTTTNQAILIQAAEAGYNAVMKAFAPYNLPIDPRVHVIK